MHSHSLDRWTHEHVFLGAQHARNERRTWLVVGLTVAMMVVEIAGGSIFGSMALLADGWHMATHALAIGIAASAYLFARRYAHDPRFAFGTGKLGELAAFASAIVLAMIALLVAWESFLRLARPVPIAYGEAMAIAAVGLIVNLGSAWLLREDHARITITTTMKATTTRITTMAPTTTCAPPTFTFWPTRRPPCWRSRASRLPGRSTGGGSIRWWAWSAHA